MRDLYVILRGDGLYHMVGTVGLNSLSIGYTGSKDLKEWLSQKLIPVMEKETRIRICWASEITYNPLTKSSIIYWASTRDGQFTETAEFKEKNYYHRICYILTNDFKIFPKSKLLYEPRLNVIDITIVPYKGKFLMFVRNEILISVHKYIFVATADSMCSPYSSLSSPITGF